MLCSTIREIIVQSDEKYGNLDAVRYKAGRNNLVSKTYRELKEDSERFSAVLKELGEQGNHAGKALRQQSGGKAYGSAQPGDPRAKQRDGIEGHQQPDQRQQQDIDRYAVQGQLMKI